MKKLLIIFTSCIVFYSCGNQNDTPSTEGSTSGEATTSADNGAAADYDTAQGAGKFRDVQIDPKLNTAMADAGEKVYDVKCGSCHKLTDERLVGPGWAGVTNRHRPEWIMNFVTNVDEMLAKDPKAQAQLEVCLVRMPNQNLSDEDARSVYEFMRKNDGIN